MGKYFFACSEGGIPFQAITAGAGNDNVELNGQAKDRLKAGRTLGLSGKLLILFEAVLAQDETLTVAANLQDAAASSFAGGDAADYGTAFPATVVATGPTGGGTVRGVVELDVDLSGARQWVREQVTLNLSASGTDTVKASSCLLIGGTDHLPAVG
jgi:hypothetical protein